MHWIFLDTGHHSGKFNMEFDESLVRALAAGTGTSTVRVYGWRPPAISLGWNQRLEEIDEAKAQDEGIDIVRRPTGGRAILHSDELTYSVTMLSEAKNVSVVYNDISRALVQGLKTLGVEASLEKSQPHFPSLYRASSSAACFSSSARYEVQIDGRKLIGSAQRRYVGQNGKDIVLQHGSILLGSDHRRLVRYLKALNDFERESLKKDFEEKTIDLSTALGRKIPFEECSRAIKTGFEKAWGIGFESTKHDYAPTGTFA